MKEEFMEGPLGMVSANHVLALIIETDHMMHEVRAVLSERTITLSEHNTASKAVAAMERHRLLLRHR